MKHCSLLAKTKCIAAIALSFLLQLISASSLRADGFIVISEPMPIPNHFPFAPLEVTYHHVTVDIADQVASTSVDEEFHNPNGRVLEGTYIFPLPDGAHIDKFTMDIDGKAVDAEMLDADKARAYYEETVRKYRDPALLEYAGRGAVRVHIFPIEANGSKHVTLKYTQALTADAGLIEYVYPLNTEKFSSQLLHDVSVTVNLSGHDPIKSVYCPSHETEIRRLGDTSAVVGYEQSNVRPDTDFKLIYSTSKSDVGANLLTYRNGSDDGYFMLLASPGLNSTQKVQAKDICFVLDTSGSMADDNKIAQAKKALTFCLANLNPDDRFQIVRFSTEIEPLFDSLVPADESHLAKARDFVAGLKPMGATALNDAFSKAISLRDAASKDRPYTVVFLTDGLPTVGETNDQKILDNIRAQNFSGHIFCFGIGTDVNTHLLDGVAETTRATSTYVTGREDIEIKVSSFFSKIREPVLTDVAVTFEGDGLRTTELYPHALPDLFKGESLTLMGRYSGSGSGTVKISGFINGEKREFSTPVNFAKSDTAHEFVPQLWATRRVGWLLDEIRIHGENAELRDEIVSLARRFGIVTPYTAYLIIEDERRRNVPISRQSFSEMEKDEAVTKNTGQFNGSLREEAADTAQQSGGQAVANAQNMDQLKNASHIQTVGSSGSLSAPMAKATTQPAGGFGGGGDSHGFGYRSTTNYIQQSRLINGRAFYQNNGIWTDSTIQSNAQAKPTEIKLGTEEYFALLKAHPEIAVWLSLGNQVDVMVGDVVYLVR